MGLLIYSSIRLFIFYMHKQVNAYYKNYCCFATVLRVYCYLTIMRNNNNSKKQFLCYLSFVGLLFSFVTHNRGGNIRLIDNDS